MEASGARPRPKTAEPAGGDVVFDFADLHLDDLRSFLDLEVRDLRTKRFQLFADFFDKLAAV